jgi:hypothetical protein
MLTCCATPSHYPPASEYVNGAIELNCSEAFSPPSTSSELKLNLGRPRAIAGIRAAGMSSGSPTGGLVVEVSMTDEEGAPRVRCNAETSVIFDTDAGGDPPHTVTCDSVTVAQFVWLSDNDGLSLCEVAVLEDTSDGAGSGAQGLAELPLNLMVHSSGYVQDVTCTVCVRHTRLRAF